jgi:hypothetical protein
MLFFLAFHFSLSLTPNCRNWSPNYSVLVCVEEKKIIPPFKSMYTTVVGIAFW